MCQYQKGQYRCRRNSDKYKTSKKFGLRTTISLSVGSTQKPDRGGKTVLDLPLSGLEGRETQRGENEDYKSNRVHGRKDVQRGHILGCFQNIEKARGVSLDVTVLAYLGVMEEIKTGCMGIKADRNGSGPQSRFQKMNRGRTRVVEALKSEEKNLGVFSHVIQKDLEQKQIGEPSRKRRKEQESSSNEGSEGLHRCEQKTKKQAPLRPGGKRKTRSKERSEKKS